jgi:RNA polymerase sigma-70 factor, ECF subfamily
MEATSEVLLLAKDAEEPAHASPVPDADRLTRLANANYQFVWRSLRRLGVAGSETDDAAQRVFILAAEKLSLILHGSERAFLFQTALRVAMSIRRTYAARREAILGDALEELVDAAPLPDANAEERERREYLDALLETLPMDLRAVLVLFEIEGLGSTEIAVMLDIPVGTVASRLRRGRAIFGEQAARLRKRLERTGSR